MPERPTATGRVATNMKALRGQRGWSQAELAAKAGLAESKVRELEDGEGKCRLRAHEAHAFARALGVHITELLAVPDTPGFQPLSDAELLAWAVVLTHRSRQGRDGTLLLPYPPCPTCGEAVDAAWQVTTDRPGRLLRDIRLTVKPCGHVHTASEDRVHRLWSDIHEVVADVTDSYDGRFGRNRKWTTEGIIQEAQARTANAPSGEGSPEPSSDTVPVRPDPRQPAYEAVYENIRSLGGYLPPDTAHRNAIIWRAMQAALDATPVGRCMSSHCVEGDHFIGLGGSDA